MTWNENDYFTWVSSAFSFWAWISSDFCGCPSQLAARFSTSVKRWSLSCCIINQVYIWIWTFCGRKITLQNFYWTWTALFSSSSSTIFLPKCCLSTSASDTPKSFISDCADISHNTQVNKIREKKTPWYCFPDYYLILVSC